MTSTLTDPAPLSNVLEPEPAAFAPPVKFGDIPERRRVRRRTIQPTHKISGHYRALLCDHCGESHLERRSRHGLIAVVFSLAGFFPHKCRKCNAKRYRLIDPFRLALAVVATVAWLAVVVNSSGVIRRLRPEPRALSSVAPASEDALFASQLSSGRVGAFEKLLPPAGSSFSTTKTSCCSSIPASKERSC